MFCYHYRGLRALYPNSPLTTLLNLHLTRSPAHAADLVFAWSSGVHTRSVTTADIREEQKLYCFIENTRRRFMKIYYPGQRYIRLESIGVLEPGEEAADAHAGRHER